MNLMLNIDNASLVNSLQSEIRVNDLIKSCLESIKNYPDDTVDEEVMTACAEFIQLSVSNNKKNVDYVMQNEGIQKIALQLIIVLEELTQDPESLGKDILNTQVKLLEKLCLALQSQVQDNIVGQASIRDLNLLSPLLIYLSQAGPEVDKAPQFAESTVHAAISLLSSSIDQNKETQDWILENVKIFEICSAFIHQRTSMKLAGSGCLLMSHLCGKNKNA